MNEQGHHPEVSGQDENARFETLVSSVRGVYNRYQDFDYEGAKGYVDSFIKGLRKKGLLEMDTPTPDQVVLAFAAEIKGYMGSDFDKAKRLIPAYLSLVDAVDDMQRLREEGLKEEKDRRELQARILQAWKSALPSVEVTDDSELDEARLRQVLGEIAGDDGVQKVDSVKKMVLDKMGYILITIEQYQQAYEAVMRETGNTYPEGWTLRERAHIGRVCMYAGLHDEFLCEGAPGLAAYYVNGRLKGGNKESECHLVLTPDKKVYLAYSAHGSRVILVGAPEPATEKSVSYPEEDPRMQVALHEDDQILNIWRIINAKRNEPLSKINQGQ